MLLLTIASLIFYSIVHFIDLVLSGELAEKMATIDQSDFANFFFLTVLGFDWSSCYSDLVFVGYFLYLWALSPFYKYFHRLTTFGVSLILLALAFCIEFNTNSTLYYRNFLFMGLPFFIMGCSSPSIGNGFNLRLIVCQEMGY